MAHYAVKIREKRRGQRWSNDHDQGVMTEYWTWWTLAHDRVLILIEHLPMLIQSRQRLLYYQALQQTDRQWRVISERQSIVFNGHLLARVTLANCHLSQLNTAGDAAAAAVVVASAIAPAHSITYH